jgi:multiple sugar transport system substrate-binding protein
MKGHLRQSRRDGATAARRRRTRLVGAVAIGAAIVTAGAGCTPSTHASKPIASPGVTASGTITFWHFFTDRESAAITGVVNDFEASHPNIKVIVKDGQDDDKMTQAIASGGGPDVGLSYSTDIVGKFCQSGAWRDLTPYIKRDKVDLSQIPGPVLNYTQYNDKRCTMPFLNDAYGIYYNKTMFAAAGITEPPKTLDDLTADAKKLTKLNPDGSIKVAGFDPSFGVYENSAAHFAPMTGAKWLTSDGKSAIGGDPAWQSLLTWQKSLVDWYGNSKLTKFNATFGDEFSAQNAFEAGKLAINMDGEWRIASIAADKSKVDYGVAPIPVSSDRASAYGSGYITGNVIGISRGSKNPEAAWAFIKYLTTNTDAMVKLANGIKNVPTLTSALNSPNLSADANFKLFLQISANPATSTTPPSGAGTTYQDDMQAFVDKWQAGKVSNLSTGLAQVDSQINQALSIAG